MATIDTLQFPTFFFQEAAETLSADNFQTAISIILSLGDASMS
jgi:hypothetical protein